MDTQPALGFDSLLTHLIGDMAQAVFERNGETQQQQINRRQAAVDTILGFSPRCVIKAILVGHCLMFHELMIDSVHETLRGEEDTIRRATRSNIVVMDKAFANSLTRLEMRQVHRSEDSRDTQEADPAQPAPEPPAAQPPTDQPPVETQDYPATAPSQAEPMIMFHQIAQDAIAACRANPEAMAALDAGDVARFARAMGLAEPSEAFLAAAAAEGSPFKRRATGSPPAPTTCATGDRVGQAASD